MRGNSCLRIAVASALVAFGYFASTPRSVEGHPVPDPYGVVPQDRARKIIFVCDVAAASIDPKKGAVTGELKNAIAGLKPFQAFSIVIAGKKISVFPKDGLAVATPSNKTDAMEFLAKLTPPQAPTNPVEAFRTAKALQPPGDLIYLLTDHEWKDSPAVARGVLDLRDKTKVNVILFHAKKDTAFSETMRKSAKSITADNGFVNEVKESDLATAEPATQPATRPVTRPSTQRGIGPTR